MSFEAEGLMAVGKTWLSSKFRGALVEARERALVRVLLSLGIGLVSLGVGIWLRRFLPGFAILLGAGCLALCAAYLLERVNRRSARSREAEFSHSGSRAESAARPLDQGGGVNLSPLSEPEGPEAHVVSGALEGLVGSVVGFLIGFVALGAIVPRRRPRAQRASR